MSRRMNQTYFECYEFDANVILIADDFELQKCHIDDMTIYDLILMIFENAKFTI